MSFLAPLFLVGALAVAGPLIFHLIRRTVRTRLPFSSLMFLKPSPPRISKRHRFEHILLLLLRCWILLLLAFGFARPFFNRPVLSTPAAAEARHLVILLDRSASMRRENLWPQAIDHAKAALKQAAPSDSVAVLVFDSRPETLISFREWNALPVSDRAKIVSERLNHLQASWAGTHLSAALFAALEQFEQGAGRGPRPALPRQQILLISDLQEGSRLEGLQGYEWPKGLEILVEQVLPKNKNNAGVQLLDDSTTVELASAPAEPKCRIINSSESKADQFILSIRSSPNSTPQQKEISVPPGQSRIVAAPKIPAGASNAVLQLTGDDHPFDNTVYLVAPARANLNVLYFGSTTNEQTTQPVFYLKRALQETRHAKLQLQEITPNESQPLPPGSEPALAIIDRQLATSEIAGVRDFIRSGKIALLLLLKPEDASTISALAQIPSLACSEADPQQFALLGEIDFSHPLFSSFADPRFSDFSKIHFWHHRQLDLTPAPAAHALARFDGPAKDPAILQLPIGQGSLLVFTFGWQPSESQFALSSKFVPLLYALLELSTRLNPFPAQWHVGDDIHFPASLSAAAQTVAKPDGASVIVPAGAIFNPDQPGIYTITSAHPPRLFAVNVPSDESRTSPLGFAELQRLGLPIHSTAAESRAPQASPSSMVPDDLEKRQRLWRWLLLAACLSVLAETWLGGWLSKHSSTPVLLASE